MEAPIFCEINGHYSNGICEDFCDEVDPDCLEDTGDSGLEGGESTGRMRLLVHVQVSTIACLARMSAACCQTPTPSNTIPSLCGDTCAKRESKCIRLLRQKACLGFRSPGIVLPPGP